MLVNFVLPNPPHPSSFPNSMLLRESHFQQLFYIKIFGDRGTVEPVLSGTVLSDHLVLNGHCQSPELVSA